MDLEVRFKRFEERLDELEQLIKQPVPPQYPYTYSCPLPPPPTHLPAQSAYYPPPPTHIPTPSAYYPPPPTLPPPPTHPPPPPTPRPTSSTTPVSTPSTPKRPKNNSRSLDSPLPLTNIVDNPNALPSSQIKKEKLMSVESVVAKYSNLVTESKMPTLAWKIAKEAVFGEDIMKMCTPIGTRDKPGLPVKEMAEFKKIMFTQCPQYWNSPTEFEGTWRKCLESVQQGCKRLRLYGKKK